MSRTRSAAAHVVVVGGGLAGLSAAVACTDAGARVTLLEGRPRFGGATWSFERKGLAFDNGQHVYLRCCTAYRRFLARLGTEADAPLQERLELPVIAPSASGPVTAWIRRGRLPAPLHLLPSLLAYRHLPIADRLRLGAAVRALLALRAGDPLDQETFGSFLARHGQRQSAISGLFDLITLPTVNVRSDEASLSLGAKVFRTGILGEADAADLGWARVPLSRLHVDPAVALLERAGATVRRKAKVEKLEVSSMTGELPAVLVDGERLEADALVLAVPHEAAAELLPPGGAVEPSALRGLGNSPIIDVHLVYDRKVLDHPVAAGLRSPVQFVFDRTQAAGLDPSEGQCLAVSVSGADAEQGERPEVLIERYQGALAELLPAARSARVVDAVVSREHAATFRGVPGTARLRPGPESGFTNVFLAGSWTDTGWPATMEGAVRSGVVASSFALHAVGTHRGVPELPEGVVA
ncbi:MAG: phytoene dehydrogenase [Acidimicrobiaceae bacterium]|nr:phytoene dehydrogenase [Acidimicrobiaceae bacterium]